MDAALADPSESADNAEKEDESKDAGIEFDENLDLESFGKKKKKKKKPFNLDEIENNLPTETEEIKEEVGGEGGGEDGNIEDDYDLDVDFSKTKKKKKKKKDLDELVAEKTEDGEQAQNENGNYYIYFLYNI